MGGFHMETLRKFWNYKGWRDSTNSWQLYIFVQRRRAWQSIRDISAAKARPSITGLAETPAVESADGLSGRVENINDNTESRRPILPGWGWRWCNYGTRFPNSNGGRTADNAIPRARQCFVGSWISGRVRSSQPAGMWMCYDQRVSGIPDDLLILRWCYVSNVSCERLSTQPVPGERYHGKRANPRIDAVVILHRHNVKRVQAVANNRTAQKPLSYQARASN